MPPIRAHIGQARPLWPWLLAALLLLAMLLLLARQLSIRPTLVSPQDAPVIQVSLLKPAPPVPEAPVEAAPKPTPPAPPEPVARKAIRPTPEPLPPEPPPEVVEQPPVEPVVEPAPPVAVAAVAPTPVAPPSVTEAEVAPAAAAPSADAIERYLEEVRRAVARERRYPSMARRRGLEGDVRVRLSIAADGRLADARIVEASIRILAPPTLKAARRAAPFPPPPAGAETIDVVLEYFLDD